MNGRGECTMEILGYWLEIDERGFVLGYSSSESYINSVYFEVSELPEDFETHFSFYRLDSDLALVFDDTRVGEIKREQEERSKIPTGKEKIKMLEDENKELNERVMFTESALLDLILRQNNLMGGDI